MKDDLGQFSRLEIVGTDSVDLTEAVRRLRQEYEISTLALEGGASLNFDFLAAGLVDELFLTFAPKLKGGVHLPTAVDGPGFPDREYLDLTLLSLYHDCDEFYFRYKVGTRRK